jgi:hypothetical protein
MSESTFQEWKDFKDYLFNNELVVKEILNKSTIDQLNKYVYKDKKSKMVDSLYSSLLTTLNLSDSIVYSPFDETYKQAYERITSKYTESDFLAYKEAKKAAHEAKTKALNNPETLEEFRTFISYKGEANLTQDQKVIYNDLIGGAIKSRQNIEDKKKLEVKKVEGVNTEMEIKETFHTKKNIPLFVVVLSNRVERDIYTELNNRAKKLGGYYSTYNKGGAIAGFIFESKENAELFAQVKDSDVTKVKDEAVKNETLKERGLKIIAEATEELNRDRNANTHRRAAMAASAENKATYKLQFGKTLIKIADKMELGQIKYLDKIKSISDLETLNSVLSSAKYKHLSKDKNLRSQDYKITYETVNYLLIPYPIVYNNLKSDLLRMKDISNGKKLAAARMLKRFGISDFIECNTPQRIEDFQTLFCNTCIVWNAWQVKTKKEIFMNYKRVERMGLNQINLLKAAMYELIDLKNGTEDKSINNDLKIKELERKYIGAKINGFFPTPESLIQKKIELLELKENDIILEPSAGLGHIADQLRNKGAKNLTCIEINTGLSEVLEAKGHKVINEDFLQHSGNYDKIIMNPPFENLQDIKHVKHAYSLLNNGGVLVATMAGNKHRTPDFIDFINENGWYEENPKNSFINSFNSTGVNTITVYLTK